MYIHVTINMFESKEVIDLMAKNATGVWVAWVWWLAHYIYKVSKGEVFSIARLIINIVLAWWIGYLCQEAGLSSVYTSIAWFCTYPLLDLIERKWPEIIMAILKK